MKKKRAGFTLLEIIVAVAVLVVVAVPIFGLFVHGTRLSVASHRLTIASFTAQLRMEELVGRSREWLEAGAGYAVAYNGFDTAFTAEFYPIAPFGLARVIVTVSEIGCDIPLAQHTHYLNITPGGAFAPRP